MPLEVPKAVRTNGSLAVRRMEQLLSVDAA